MRTEAAVFQRHLKECCSAGTLSRRTFSDSIQRALSNDAWNLPGEFPLGKVCEKVIPIPFINAYISRVM
jgi:hypothetical protein